MNIESFVDKLEEYGFSVLKNESEGIEVDNLVFTNTNDTEFHMKINRKVSISECGFRKLGKRKRNMETGELKDFDFDKALTM